MNAGTVTRLASLLLLLVIAPTAAASSTASDPVAATTTAAAAGATATTPSTITDALPLHLVVCVNEEDPARFPIFHEVLAEILQRLASTDTGESALFSFGSVLRSVSRQPLARGAPAADDFLHLKPRPAPDPVGVLRSGYATAISLAAPGQGRAALVICGSRSFNPRHRDQRGRTFEELLSQAGLTRPGTLALPVYWLDLRPGVRSPVTESRVGPVLVYSGEAGSPEGRTLGTRIAALLHATPPLLPDTAPASPSTAALLESQPDVDGKEGRSMALAWVAPVVLLIALASAAVLARRRFLHGPDAATVGSPGELLPESAPPDLELRPLPDLPARGLALLPSDGGRERRFPFPTGAASYTVDIPGLELPLSGVEGTLATLTLTATRRADLAATGAGVRLNAHSLHRVETTLKEGQVLDLGGNRFAVSFYS